MRRVARLAVKKSGGIPCDRISYLRGKGNNTNIATKKASLSARNNKEKRKSQETST